MFSTHLHSLEVGNEIYSWLCFTRINSRKKGYRGVLFGISRKKFPTFLKVIIFQLDFISALSQFKFCELFCAFIFMTSNTLPGLLAFR